MRYEINENLARRSHDMMSMRDYKPNEATESYNAKCEEAEAIYKKVASQCATDAQIEHAQNLLNKYCKVLAYAINEENRIGCMCPSVLVSGAGNFPTRKKEKQVNAWNSNRENFNKAEHYLNLLKGVSSQGIQSNDPQALEALKQKLANLKSEHLKMKRINLYYRKNNTLDGCPDLSSLEIAKLKKDMDRFPMHQPYPSYCLQNNNQNMKRIEKRIKELEEAKNTEASKTEYDGFKYIENTEEMRVQFIFDGKPDEDTRNALKRNGFRWAPSQGAWQRQLTSNGKYAAKQVIKALNA